MLESWGGVDVSEDRGVRFGLTIFGATPLILRSAQRSFTSATTVRVGGVLCDNAVSSDDGKWLAFLSPRPSAICNNSAADCSYASLTVSNPPSGTHRGATLVCPPFCSGTLAPWSDLIPVSVGDAGAIGGFFAARAQQPDALPVVLSASDFDSFGTRGESYSPGIYFAAACSAGGIYTDPSTGACMNQSDPAFALCAFGGGDSCEACPLHAICPGGARCWSLPGFYVASEGSSTVLPCGAPDAQARCTGWSAALSQTKCGPNYLQARAKVWCAAACACNVILSDNAGLLSLRRVRSGLLSRLRWHLFSLSSGFVGLGQVRHADSTFSLRARLRSRSLRHHKPCCPRVGKQPKRAP